MSFSMTADRARSARADAEMAKLLKLWGQQAEQTALRGEMTAPTRLKLLEAVAAVLDHPRVS
jgi:hypothetical protein